MTGMLRLLAAIQLLLIGVAVGLLVASAITGGDDAVAYVAMPLGGVAGALTAIRLRRIRAAH